METSIRKLSFCVLVILALTAPSHGLTGGEIYSLDSLANGNGVQLSLAVRPDGSVAVEESGENQPQQRFIAKLTTGGTLYNLFLEAQPWNWVDHIVESSKTVNIKVTPQLLDVVMKDGVHTVTQSDYKGQSTNSEKWYLVPQGADENVGTIVNLLSKFCLVNNGVGAPATLGICNPNDAKYIWRLNLRTQNRCY